MAISVMSKTHLDRLGLNTDDADKDDDDNNKDNRDNNDGGKENELDLLVLLGLEKIAFLPYAYILDKWRWDVFSGKIKPEHYNAAWWEMR